MGWTLPSLYLFPRTPLKSNLDSQRCRANDNKWPLANSRRFLLNCQILYGFFLGSHWPLFLLSQLTLPTWRDDILPLIALSFHVHVSSLPTLSLERTAQPERLNHTPLILLTSAQQRHRLCALATRSRCILRPLLVATSRRSN